MLSSAMGETCHSILRQQLAKADYSTFLFGADVVLRLIA